jgi:hypothetical protein
VRDVRADLRADLRDLCDVLTRLRSHPPLHGRALHD